MKAWNNKIKEADAFIVVTPEYNHSLPGVLKNAIDSVFVSFAFRNKPIAAVGYSAGIGAGVRAIEHLAHVAIEAEAVPLRNTVVLPFVTTAFDEHGEPIDRAAGVSLDVMLDDLAWWSNVLEGARAAGELLPGAFRARAAMAAAEAAGTVETSAWRPDDDHSGQYRSFRLCRNVESEQGANVGELSHESRVAHPGERNASGDSRDR